MTVAQLKAQAKAQGIKVPAGAKKADLQQLLASSPAKQAVGKPAAQPTKGKIQPKAQQQATAKVKAKAKGDRFENGDLILDGATYTPGATLNGSTNPQLSNGPKGKAKVVKGGAKGQNVAENTAQRVMAELTPPRLWAQSWWTGSWSTITWPRAPPWAPAPTTWAPSP